MDYRIVSVETEEEKAKERAFTGLGLTSRKNLCLNHEVSPTIYVNKLHIDSPERYPERRRALW